MAHGAATDVVLAHLVDADRRHDARVHPQALQRILHGECVHDGGEHAHVVGGHAVHAGARQARTAKDIAPADDHGDLHFHLPDILQLASDALDDGRVDAVVGVAHQGLPRELHQDPRVRRLGFGHKIHLIWMEKTPRSGGV